MTPTVAPTVPVVDQDAAAQTMLTVNAADGVLAGATDPAASEPLSVSAVNGLSAGVGNPVATAYGTLTLNADGSYSYAATASPSSLPNGAALDNVAFTVSDSHGNAVTSTLSNLVTTATTRSMSDRPAVAFPRATPTVCSTAGPATR